MSTSQQTLTSASALACYVGSVVWECAWFCAQFLDPFLSAQVAKCIFGSISCVRQNMKYLVKNMRFFTFLLWHLSKRPFYTTRLTPALFWAHSTHNTDQYFGSWCNKLILVGHRVCRLPCQNPFYVRPSLVSSFMNLWREDRCKSQALVRRIPSRGAWTASGREREPSRMRSTRRHSNKVLFDVSGKNDAAAVILSNLWQSTEGISPLEKQAQTRHRVVLVMSQHVLDVITTNTTRSGAEK